MKDWIQVLAAADAAAKWHVHQRRRLEYADWAEKVVSGLKPLNQWLQAEFAAALKMAREATALSRNRS